MIINRYLYFLTIYVSQFIVYDFLDIQFIAYGKCYLLWLLFLSLIFPYMLNAFTSIHHRGIDAT